MQTISISIYVFIYIKYIDMLCSFNILSDIGQKIFVREVSWTAPDRPRRRILRPLRSKRSPPWLTVCTAISKHPPLVSKNSHVNCKNLPTSKPLYLLYHGRLCGNEAVHFLGREHHALSAFGFMVSMTTAFLFTFFYTVARTFSVRVGETRSEDSDDDYHSSTNYDIH